MKEELIDEGYDSAEYGNNRKRSMTEEEETKMVAKRIRQMLGMKEGETQEVIIKGSTGLSRSTPRRPSSVISSPAPLVFDHFICMRIGLNSENNVQKLMALLTAHNFVDLTVMPTPSIVPPTPLSVISSPLSRGVNWEERIATARGLFCEPSTSRMKEDEAIRPYQPKKYAPRRQPGDNLPGIPTMLTCTKCKEVMGTGATCNSVLAHVQKFHLKMAAFQCRICKHYRTTQERIQSHVTTVHKAKSTTFDDSLAGPISESDMGLMEKMITKCFPEISVKLEITDRLSVRSFQLKKDSPATSTS